MQERDCSFWIERVAIVILALHYWVTCCWYIGIGLFVLSNAVYIKYLIEYIEEFRFDFCIKDFVENMIEFFKQLKEEFCSCFGRIFGCSNNTTIVSALFIPLDPFYSLSISLLW
jgi:hypothetical protein